MAETAGVPTGKRQPESAEEATESGQGQIHRKARPRWVDGGHCSIKNLDHRHVTSFGYPDLLPLLRQECDERLLDLYLSQKAGEF